MTCYAAIVNGPLTPEAQGEAVAAAGGPRDLVVPSRDGTRGAVLRFEGIVRRSEPCAQRGGAAGNLRALDYETYDPMAQRELELLARDVGARHGLISILALHSRGRVAVGEVSFVLEVGSAHRAETLAAAAEFIDRLKQDVPIWKKPVWA